MKLRFFGFAIICSLIIAMVSPWQEANASPKGDFTVIIDAGHGGHDIGAPGTITNEKDINLSVALILGKLLEKEPDIKVVYTRNTDKFVTLQGRADIANRNNGNLFISIHTNSVDKKSKSRTTVNGAAVYTLGPDRSNDNLAVAMRENSVMKLERDYTSTYQGFDPSSAESYIIFEMAQDKYMRQSINAAAAVAHELSTTAGRKNNGVRQANFWVLLKTAMPAMLVELDFICNPTQEKFMASEKGQRKLAEAIYNGTMEYKKSVSANTSKSQAQSATLKENATTDSDTSKDEPVYKIQFLTTPRNLKEGARELKGLSPVESYTEKGVKKYTYGSFATEEAAMSELKNVRKLFPDAFVITFKGGKRIR